MKKLILAAVMAFACSSMACDSDSTSDPIPTAFTDIVYPPSVAPAQPVMVTANLSNASGLSKAWLVYFVNDDQDHPTTIAQTMYDGARSGTFIATIPAQAADATVTFQLVASDTAGSLTASPLFTCKVRSDAEN